MKTILVPLSVLALFAGCATVETESRPGDVYRKASRPQVWKVLPFSPAEEVGMQPGDLVITYNRQPVRSNDEIREAQARALGSSEEIPVVVLRKNVEVELRVPPGPLGALPVAARYPSSLALALEDIMTRLGVFTDYDWLAALTGESFTFTAHEDACRAWWPGGKSHVYLDAVQDVAGLEFRQVHTGDATGEAVTAIRGELLKGRQVLVQGGWPDHRAEFWGLVTRYDQDEGLLFGYSLDAADELPLVGDVLVAYVVELDGEWAAPDVMVRTVLTQALELAQVRSDEGWKSGLDAWNLLIVSLETVPFCPVCGEEESQACLERLVWTMVAHKESANRFLEWMRLAVPDQAALIDDIVGDNNAVIGKLQGMMRSGVQVGTIEDQRKLARAFLEIEVIENDLIGGYENLLGAL